MVTSGSEQTAGRSRLTRSERFASGRRPGWLRPREVRFSHTSANHSSRLPSLPLVARPPTGARSCRSMTTATSFNPRPTSCPRSTSTASDRRRTRGVEAPGTADWDAVCADERKTPPQDNARRFGEPHPDGRNDRSRSSRVVRQPEDRCRSAIGRAILRAILSMFGSGVPMVLYGRTPRKLIQTATSTAADRVASVCTVRCAGRWCHGEPWFTLRRVAGGSHEICLVHRLPGERVCAL